MRVNYRTEVLTMLNSIIFVVVLMTVIFSIKKYAKKLSKKYCCEKSDDL
jgi:hypothetical protein